MAFHRETGRQQGVCQKCAQAVFDGGCPVCEGTGQQPAQPGSGEVRVRRFWAEDLPSMDVEVVFAQDFDRLQSALTTAKAYSDDLETRYHTAHERLTAAQRRIAALESGLSEAIEIMARGERLLPEGEARFRLILEGKEPA